MDRTKAGAEPLSLADLLDVEVTGRTWCFVELGSDSGFSVHRGETAFLHVILHGQVTLACTRDQPVLLGGGTAILVPPGEAHALRTSQSARMTTLDHLREDGRQTMVPTFRLGRGAGQNGARVLSGRLRIGRAAELLQHLSSPGLRIASGAGGDAWIGLLKRLSRGSGAPTLLTRAAAPMVLEALRDQYVRGDLTFQDDADPISRVTRLVAAEPARDWTVASMARAAGMGRSHFAARFPERTGQAPMSYVTEVRMELAHKLLTQDAAGLSEIAGMVGYTSDAAFIRRFKQIFGLHPKDARTSGAAVSQTAAQEVRSIFAPQESAARSLAIPSKPSDRNRRVRFSMIKREP